jgi:hypothetical protein
LLGGVFAEQIAVADTAAHRSAIAVTGLNA